MANYPTAVDTFTTIQPSDLRSTSPTLRERLNLLQSAVTAIESELGLSPSSTYSTVAARFADLPRTVMLTVASADASTAVRGHADYVCDGVADDVEINAALATGASVQLSSGRFTLATPVVVAKAGQMLSGCGLYQDRTSDGLGVGGGTLLLLSASFNGGEAVRVHSGSATIATNANTIRDLSIRGTATATSTTKIGTNLVGLLWRSYQGTVDNVEITLMSGDGVYVQSVGSWEIYDTRFSNIHSSANGAAGFSIGSGDGHLSQSIFHNNGTDGIWVGGSSWQITQVHCYANTLNGIYLSGGAASRTKIANSKIEHSGHHGIHLDGSAGTGQDGVQIVGCGFNSNSETTNDAYSHINAQGNGALWRSSIVGCVFGNSDNSANKPRYVFELADQCRYLVIADNNLGDDNGGANAAAYLGSGALVSSSKIQGNVGITDQGAA